MKLSLTRVQRAAFFSRDKTVAWPTLAGEGVPPVKVGYVHRLSSRLSFEVTKVSFKNGKWSLEYKIHDDREECFYLLPTARSVPIDERGNVTPMAPEEEIGYSRNPKSPRADYLRSVPPNVQNVIDMQARLASAERRREDDPEREAKEDLRRVNAEVKELIKRAVKMGIDPSSIIAPIAREVQEQHRQLSEAA